MLPIDKIDSFHATQNEIYHLSTETRELNYLSL